MGVFWQQLKSCPSLELRRKTRFREFFFSVLLSLLLLLLLLKYETVVGGGLVCTYSSNRAETTAGFWDSTDGHYVSL